MFVTIVDAVQEVWYGVSMKSKTTKSKPRPDVHANWFVTDAASFSSLTDPINRIDATLRRLSNSIENALIGPDGRLSELSENTYEINERLAALEQMPKHVAEAMHHIAGCMGDLEKIMGRLCAILEQQPPKRQGLWSRIKSLMGA